MEKSLLVAIPAYNEEESIGIFLEKLKAYEMWSSFDLIVINDGSKDNTEGICRSAGVKVINHIFNMGYGAALKTAYKYACEHNYDYVIQIDGDGQHDVCNIEKIYTALTTKEPSPDIVVGTRFLEGSVTFKISFAKKVVMAMFNLLVKLSTKNTITDPTSGLQGLSKRAFNYYAYGDNFATDYPDINMIIQMMLLGYDITEIPAVMHRREAGTSMHSGLKPLKYLIKMLISSTAVILRASSEKSKIKK